ncbi:DUF2851 family protein [Flavobacterium pedocola]
MSENFLHYVWQHQLFAVDQLQTVQGEAFEVLNAGECLQHTKPYFFNAQLLVGTLRWAGNVVVQLKSSDWFSQKEEIRSFENNCILLVVYEHDMPKDSSGDAKVPILELKHYLDQKLIDRSEWLSVKKIIKFVAVLWD